MRTLITLFALIACALAATRQKPLKIARRELRVSRASCANKYEKLGAQAGHTHTMCDPNYAKVTSGSVSKTEKAQIVDKHNALRSDPKTSVTAKAMCKVYWDDEIAEVAQHFAESCPLYGEGHDKMRDVPGYGIGVGQNLAWGFFTWDAAIQAWFDEVVDFGFGVGSINGKPVGHYTQVVKDTTCRIGCGFANCNGKTTYVCNYATGQQDYTNPFKTGSPCEACPTKCENNLCDCQGKMCYNGGTLDMHTCTCTCSDMYSGDSCQTLNCKADVSYCGKAQPYGYPESFCSKYSNVPDECPVMCHTCHADGTAGDSFIPAPATQLIGGTGEIGSSVAAGDVGAAQDVGNTGAGGNADCSADRDFCTTWVKQEWCDWGEYMTLTYNGEEGNPHSFCPYKCGLC